jgi:cytochrome P450
MASFDAEAAQTFEANRQLVMQMMQQQNQPAEAQMKLLDLMNSAEYQAGVAIASLGMMGALILLFSAGGGAFTGMLRGSHSPRPGLRRGD